MRVFLTGASGFIGSAIIPKLQAAGHEVLGLARNDQNAVKLQAAGVAVHPGDLAEPETLAAGAAACDATIHCAFIHDFSQFVENIAIDRRAVEAMLGALEGSGKPFVLTSGVLMVDAGREATEEDAASTNGPGAGRGATEAVVEDFAARGVQTAIIRLPQVHDTERQGLVTYAIRAARENGVSAYVGDGSNRWAAAHVDDVSTLYRLVLENGEAGARYHAVGESGVAMRDIAEAIGRRLGLPAVSIAPEQAMEHFGFVGMFALRDAPVSSRLTRERLGWTPAGPTLVDDLEDLQLADA
ncbi:MAG TPA: SDR family oxidoreductase [Phenylobacterium sp.]|uniref:SDR family oxidoreductase n=1 Tax=Phenylobacterium sp. TaxID=1871053 RepID=UPI002C35BB98|nr:SDR family oxidoreductase [Phenylobacterium sp.]HSV03981.1 SDR family oxidoreductase [Phenylobacterium sp.]